MKQPPKPRVERNPPRETEDPDEFEAPPQGSPNPTADILAAFGVKGTTPAAGTDAVPVLAGQALVHLGAFMQLLGNIIVLCQAPQQAPHAAAKALIVEQLRREVSAINAWLTENPRHANARRMREIKREIEAAIGSLQGCTPEGERAAKDKLTALTGDAIATGFSWRDPNSRAELELGSELTRMLFWLDLYKQKRGWRTGTGHHSDPFVHHLTFVYDEEDGDIQIQRLTGTPGTVVRRFPVDPSKKRTPEQKAEIRRVLDELNTKLNACNYPDAGDTRILMDFARPA